MRHKERPGDVPDRGLPTTGVCPRIVTPGLLEPQARSTTTSPRSASVPASAGVVPTAEHVRDDEQRDHADDENRPKRMPWQSPRALPAMYVGNRNVSVLKSFVLAIALVIGISTMADAAPRRGGRSIPWSRTCGTYTQNPTTGPVTAGDGYSADPHTRYLEMLADKYKPSC
jgi:hypothetical protein